MKKQNENKVDWLDKHSKASMRIFDIVIDLRSLAKSFSITGNTHMSTSLMFIAFDIEKANKDMHDAIGESLQEIIKRSHESFKTLLETALIP